MSFFVVDVEADGPCPGLYSMVSFGAVLVEPGLSRTFMRTTAPITEQYVPEALAVSGHSRAEHEQFGDPATAMIEFAEWLGANSKGRPVFVSDNPAFDWQWINYYFHCYTGANPFGFSARRIGDIYAGMQKNAFASNDWKRLRRTRHTHNPVDDAMGNAEALLAMQQMGLKINFT